MRERSLIDSINEKAKREQEIDEAFEHWFNARASAINPLMTKENARRIFKEAFDLGFGHGLSQIMGTIMSSLKEKDGGL